jgi:hypothetical protein
MTTTVASRRVAGRTPVLLGATGALLLVGVAVAGPGAALEDPRRPAATVSRGPSCGSGDIRVLVVNGTEAHRVALVLAGVTEQDPLVLAPDERAVLHSGHVDWGSTVSVAVSVATADGTGVAEPVELGSYSRPSRADCGEMTGAAPSKDPVARRSGAPAAGTTAPRPGSAGTSTTGSSPTGSSPTGSSSAGSSPTGSPAGATPTGAPTADPTGSGTPTGSADPQTTPPGTTAEPGHTPPAGSTEPDRQPAGPVAPGGVVTVHGSGFAPGEPVLVSVPGSVDPLATVTAAPDGSVEAVVQIPRATGLGVLTLQLVGQRSAATAGLDLRVAARVAPVDSGTTSPPALAAGAALLMTGAALGVRAAFTPRTRTGGRHRRR